MWEEREIVCYLIDYHSDPKLTHQARIDAIKDGVERQLFFQYANQKKYGRSSPNITEDTHEEWKKIRYIVDECLEDGYLREEKVEHKADPVYSIEYKPPEQYLFLTAKGKKLARARYYYLKYLPEEFGDFKIILLTILGTIITSPIWKPIIESVGGIVSPWFRP